MSDRAIVGVMPALPAGFIAGLIVATLRLEDGTATWLGIIVGVALFALGAVSVVRAGGRRDERVLVGLLRALGAVALFVCVYLFMLSLLGGAVLWALVWALLAAGLGIPLSQVRVRRRPTDDEEQPTAGAGA